MGTRSSQLWQISQLLEMHPPIETIPEFRARYPQITIKYPKLGDDQLEEVIRRISEAKSNRLDPLAYYPAVEQMSKADRNAEIIRLVNTSRMSYTAIGKRFEISRERVRQIVDKFKDSHGVQNNRAE